MVGQCKKFIVLLPQTKSLVSYGHENEGLVIIGDFIVSPLTASCQKVVAKQRRDSYINTLKM